MAGKSVSRREEEARGKEDEEEKKGMIYFLVMK